MLPVLVVFIANLLDPKPCQAHDYHHFELAKRYDQAYSPRLYISGRWVHPDGIAQEINENMDELHACDVHLAIIGKRLVLMGLANTPFNIKTNRAGEVIWVRADIQFIPDTPVAKSIECLTQTLEELNFPPSLGRATRITLIYSGAMQKVQDPLDLSLSH